jgi:hypothetical protein
MEYKGLQRIFVSLGFRRYLNSKCHHLMTMVTGRCHYLWYRSFDDCSLPGKNIQVICPNIVIEYGTLSAMKNSAIV